jgi:hypothetical protein
LAALTVQLKTAGHTVEASSVDQCKRSDMWTPFLGQTPWKQITNQIKNLIQIKQEGKFRVTRLGEISPFGQFYMALGKIFSRKNHPMIWAKF